MVYYFLPAAFPTKCTPLSTPRALLSLFSRQHIAFLSPSCVPHSNSLQLMIFLVGLHADQGRRLTAPVHLHRPCLVLHSSRCSACWMQTTFYTFTNSPRACPTRASRTTPYCHLISRTHWKTVGKHPDKRVLWDSSAKSRFWPLSAPQFATKVHPSNSHRTRSSTFVSPSLSSCSLTGHCCSNRCRSLAAPIVSVVRPGTCCLEHCASQGKHWIIWHPSARKQMQSLELRISGESLVVFCLISLA